MEGKPSDGREYSTGMNVARFSCTRALDHVMWNHSTEGFHSSPVFSQGGYVSLKGRRSNGKGKTQRVQAGNRGNSQLQTGNKQILNGGCQHARESPNIKWEKEIQTGQACKEDSQISNRKRRSKQADME
ncbi:hypothetical protein TNCV_2750221 [Trichonephila clavipes]|nr:hypothetical protein TNCV_2750221 [Trichonephila clavipes]